MKNSKEKSLNKNTFIIASIAILVVIVSIIICILISNNSNKLTDFEKIAIYGYLGNTLDVNELYALSGNSTYDPLTSSAVEIKAFLENYTSNNNTDTVPAESIPNTNNIDFHGILISDYEYMPEENVFKRTPGANSNMKIIESSYNSRNEENIVVTDMKKLSNSSYEVYFNIVDSYDTDFVSNNGMAVIEVNEDNSFKTVSCSLEK